MSERLWYYIVNNAQQGPITEAQLKQLFFGGQLEPWTQVWTEGVANWAPADQYQEFAVPNLPPVVAPPPVPPSIFSDVPSNSFGSYKATPSAVRTENVEKLDPNKLHPWQRYFARSIDLNIYNILFLILLGLGMLVTIGAKLGLAATVAVAIIAWVPTNILLEPFLFSTWGTTPGKALANIKVRHADGSQLSFGQALQRYLTLLLCTGMLFVMAASALANVYLTIQPYLWLPALVSVGCMAYQYFCMLKTGRTVWDNKQDLTFAFAPKSGFRVFAFVIVLLTTSLVSGLLTLGVIFISVGPSIMKALENVK